MNIPESLERVRGLLSHELFKLGQTPITLFTLVTVLLVVLASLLISRLVRAALRRALRRHGIAADQGGVGVATGLLHYGILIVGFAVALQTAGVELGALFAAGAVFAVGIGLGMQNIAQNFVSGVILMLERSTKPGDIIEVETRMVRVIKMGIRATLVRTLDDEDVIVPNSTLVQSSLKNFTLQDDLCRLRIVVGVHYGSDLALVRRTLEQVGAALTWADKERGVRVLLVAFGSSSVDFELSVWSHDPWNAQPARSEVREAIWQAFKQHQVVIAYPQLDVHFDPSFGESMAGLGRRDRAMVS
jgi:small-conductance mechanosensitive channel